MVLFCQLDYPEELGTGVGATIAHFGCAEVSVTSVLVNIFQKQTDPHILNQDLKRVFGFASNNAGAVDLIEWEAVTKIYPDITLLFNEHYYNPPAGDALPADMTLVDSQLSKGFSVIAGVSFNHSPKEPVPTHYVEIYKKNSDGTYQCRDPWYKDGDHNFDQNYAVNGMNVAECILQLISYTGKLPQAQDAVSQQKASDLETALAQGSAVQVNADTVKPVAVVAVVAEESAQPADTGNTITVPQSDYERLKTSNNLYQAMSSAGYNSVTDIDNLKINMLKEIQAVKTDTEEKLKTAQNAHDEDFKTIHDLEAELLSTNQECEMATRTANEQFGKKSVAISRTIELEDKVKQLEDDFKTLISASGIPTKNTTSVMGIVKYFANLRFAAEKVFQSQNISKPDDTGNMLLKSFGFKVLVGVCVIGIPAAFFFIKQVMAFIK